jgi:hypothetical protein
MREAWAARWLVLSMTLGCDDDPERSSVQPMDATYPVERPDAGRDDAALDSSSNATGPSDSGVCDPVLVVGRRIPNRLWLLIDRSASAGEIRERVREALLGDAGVLGAADLDLELGAIAHEVSAEAESCPSLTELAPSRGGASAIEPLFGPSTTQLASAPAAQYAIERLLRDLPGLDETPRSADSVLLLRGNAADEICESDRERLQIPMQVDAKVAAGMVLASRLTLLSYRGVRTTILDFAERDAGPPRYESEKLAMMAQLRGPVERPGSPEELETALRSVVERSRTCTFALAGRVEGQSVCTQPIKVGDHELSCGKTPGFELHLSRAVEITGPLCDELMENNAQTVELRLPCGSFRPD